MAQAPGKLYLAGEYAVVEPGQPALVFAVNRYIHVSIEKSPSPSFHSINYTPDPLNMVRDTEDLWKIKTDDTFYHLAEQTLNIFEKLVPKRMSFSVRVDSELDAEDKTKYGLGSSGALTAALVQALNDFYDLNLTLLDLYKVAVVTQLSLGMEGSFGDIATSLFQGLIHYKSPDQAWIKEQMKKTNLWSLIYLPWPGLKIEKLNWPESWQILVGWTGQPVSTDQQVKKARTGKVIDKDLFLEINRASINNLIEAMAAHDFMEFKAHLEMNRQNLLAMTAQQGIPYETDLLHLLVESAKAKGAAAKVSGSGGGDCGLAIIRDTASKAKIISDWKAAGITNLDLRIAHLKGEKSWTDDKN